MNNIATALARQPVRGVAVAVNLNFLILFIIVFEFYL